MRVEANSQRPKIRGGNVPLAILEEGLGVKIVGID
jgi:hypothetical protein